MEQSHYHIEGIYAYYVSVRRPFPNNKNKRSFIYYKKYARVWIIGETAKCYKVILKTNSVRNRSMGDITYVLKKNVTLLPTKSSNK